MPPPTARLGLLFSATLSYRVTELAYEHMNNPELVKIESDKVTADRVTQKLYHTANEEKLPLLVGLLRHMDPHRTLVFANTKGGAERVRLWLRANGFEAEVISGDVPQTKRERLLHDFQSGALPILIGTDVAARGLHIPDVSHVFNYDLPQDCEDYVHRIGRTARAGASGDAVSFACEQYSFSLPEIEDYIGHKIPVERITAELLPALTPPAREARHERDRELGREPGERPGRGRRDERGRRESRGGHGARRPEHRPAAGRTEAPAPAEARHEPVPAEARPPARPAAREGARERPKGARPGLLRRRKIEIPAIG
jgi:ATP-dependent RNA helicase RhlB